MSCAFRSLVAAATLVAVVLWTGEPAEAATVHVSPDGAGDGTTPDSPTSAPHALSAAEAGDHIVLHAGYYGDLSLSARFGQETFVEGAEDGEVRVRTLTVKDSENLTVSGLSVSLFHAESYDGGTLVSVVGDSRFVTVSDCDIFSVPDSEIGDWSASDWADLPGTGVNVRSPDVTITRNRIRNVSHGISINYDAPRATVSHNHIQNFSRDGLRGIANDGLFEYNVVLDAYDVDDHHDDFFQSWSYEDGVVGKTVVRGVVLRGNLFVNFTDPERPFAGPAQGIGCFDGFFENWIVENNVVVVNHWHGITFLGARNMRIVNNTVLDNLLDEGPGPPWINVSSHKDGRPSSDIVIRNNLTQKITLEAADSVEDHNLLFSDPGALFVDHLGFDLRLLPTADALDTGSGEDAPPVDLDRIPRPQGEGFDVGAFEWHDGSVEPVGSEPPALGSGGTSSGSFGGGAGGAGAPGTGPGEAPGSDGSGPEGAARGEGCSCHQGAGSRGSGSGTTGLIFAWSVTCIWLRRRARRW